MHFVNNKITMHFVNNKITMHFANNKITMHFVNNKITMHFVNNKITMHFVNNKITMHFANNKITMHFVNNKITMHFANNKITIQSYLSIAYTVHSRDHAIADTFVGSWWNHSGTEENGQLDLHVADTFIIQTNIRAWMYNGVCEPDKNY